MKTSIITIVLVLGLAALAWGFAPGGPGHPGKKPGMEMLKTWIELDLTDSQKSKAADILKGYRDEIVMKRRAVRVAFEQAHESRPEPGTFDENAIRAAHKRISQAMVEMLVLKDKIISELYVLLAPEQQRILKERMEKRPPMPVKPGQGKHMKKQRDELPLLDAFIQAND